MISETVAKRYCCEDISMIENYEQAISDTTRIWHCHHRAEILPCGRFSMKTLKEFGLYYGVPASQLIFLTKGEHTALHHIGTRASGETRNKMRQSHIGLRHSEKSKQKMVGFKGRHHTEEAKEKNRMAHVGKKASIETRRRMSSSRIGQVWYTDGKIETKAY